MQLKEAFSLLIETDTSNVNPKYLHVLFKAIGGKLDDLVVEIKDAKSEIN